VVLCERTFTHSGTEWRVQEVLDANGHRSLVFDRGSMARRVRSIPPDWSTLDEDALVELSWTR
jgi:hypothetical protein